MAYDAENWLDRNVSTPTDYVATKSGGGSISSGDTLTMTASPGTVTEAGTTINAVKMNNIESGLEDIYNGDGLYVVTTGSANTYVATFTTAYTAYTTGLTLRVNFNASCTGASTINVDTLGAKTIKVIGSDGKVDTKTGDIISGGVYLLVYDGTDFVLTSANALLQSTVTAQGDILYASGANTITRLAKGTATQALLMNSGATAPEWGDRTLNNSGSFLEGTSVGASSFYEKNVALGSSDFKFAIITISSNDSASDYETGGVVITGTTSSEAGGVFTDYVSSYVEMNAGNKTVQTYLTNPNVDISGSSNASYVALDECYINGSNLYFKWINNSGSAFNLGIRVQWKVIG